MMYTTDELGKMNGAKMLPTLKSALAEELEKRVNLYNEYHISWNSRTNSNFETQLFNSPYESHN